MAEYQTTDNTACQYTSVTVVADQHDEATKKVSTALDNVGCTNGVVTTGDTPAITENQATAQKDAVKVVFMATASSKKNKKLLKITKLLLNTTNEDMDIHSILVVTRGDVSTCIPSELKNCMQLDYENDQFVNRFKQVIQGWKLNGFNVRIMMGFQPDDANNNKINTSTVDLQRMLIEFRTDQPLHQEFGTKLNVFVQHVMIHEEIMIYGVHTTPLGDISDSLEVCIKKAERDCEHMASKIVKDYLSKEPTWIKCRLTISAKATNSMNDGHSPMNVNNNPNLVDDYVFDTVKGNDGYGLFLHLTKTQHPAALRSHPNGYNIMHEIIMSKELDLLKYLVFFDGLWEDLIEDQVPMDSPSTFRGQTPKKLAESFTAQKYKKEIFKLDTLVKSKSNFLKMCHKGNLQAVQKFMTENPTCIQDKDYMNNNSLYWTIASNNLELFQYLLDKGANSKHVNSSQENLLHVACLLGRHRFIKPLLLRCKLDITAVSSTKRTPLELVAESGDVMTMKELLDCGILITSCVLPYAAANKRFDLIKYLLEESKRYIDIDIRDNGGRSALMRACETDHEQLVEYLITKGANINADDLRRRTPLYAACYSGNLAVVEILLEKGAQVNMQDYYTGADLINLVRGKDHGRPAWHYVEVRRHAIHIFLERTRAGQVDVALYGKVLKSGWGENPEPSAVEWIERLIASRRNGPDASPDMMPLHVAIFRQHPEVARLLVERGADIHVADHWGMTPYLMCALRNDIATAALLESKGAKTDVRDKEGKSALDIAELNQQEGMVNYLRAQNQAKPVEVFMTERLPLVVKALDPEHLEKLRSEGRDVRRYIIDTLRDLNIDINITLCDLDSSPILRESAAQ